MSFFTPKHFSLINKWAKKKYDKNDPQHLATYKELVEVYKLVERWANAFQKRAFPDGFVAIRKNPVNQGQKFESYMWAKVYPRKDSPKELAYTVGVSTDGIELKIDTVALNEKNEQRKKYLTARGDYLSSGIVSVSPILEATKLDFEQLVDFSLNKLSKFEMDYDELVEKVGLFEVTKFEYIAKCNASSSFRKFLVSVGKNKKIFDEAIKVLHQASPNFDLYNIDRASSCLRFGNKESVSKRGKAAGYFRVEKGLLTLFFSKRYDRGEPRRIILTEDVEQNEKHILESIEEQMTIFKENSLFGSGRWPIDYGDVELAERVEDEKMDTAIPLNQILYGPPGTGKTFHTIEAAVNAAEPNFQANSRGELKAKYDELVAEKRIRFVTFHQSYGYEEFVEGLRANSDEGVISYDVEPGIFRQICTDASKNIAKSMQLNSKTDFSVCWDEFLNAFDEDGVKIQTKKSFFMVTEITDKTIHFEKAQGTSHHSLAIKTLRGVFDGSKVIKGGLNVYYQPLVEHLKQFSQKDTLVSEPLKNFVLIIDEINRGNISKIFGELITLIEDSKRAHPTNTEALEVVLPNSGDSFSVPSNLYLIGTMNTADRSLAMMDTALRRRFDFVEMMPKPHLFDGILVEGISITKLLFTMNKRIEALYDREHTLGHAFFVPVMLAFESGDEQRAFEELKSVFTNKVIPLLEEYFFDDWNKIRLVLGDNQKPEYLQFVTQDEVPYQELFGDNHGLDTYEQAQSTYSLVSYLEQDTVWDNAAAYQAIYTSDNV